MNYLENESMRSITLDVLIPLRNEGLHLQELLASFEKQQIPKELKVRYIFSDNFSLDDSIPLIKNSHLQNMEIHSQKSDIGGFGNFHFLLNQIKSDYFMFIDGHDLLSENYFDQFYEAVKNDLIKDQYFSYIGDIHSLVEENNQFKVTDIQTKMILKKSNLIRALQLTMFLGHNSIYHCIIPVNKINIQGIRNSKSWTIDHLITHAALAQTNLKYLKNVSYIRRYRKIVGPNFSTIINNKLVSRQERGQGELNFQINDRNLHHEIIGVMDSKILFFFKIFLKLMLRLKYSKNKSSLIIFRFFRYVLDKFFSLNPQIMRV